MQLELTELDSGRGKWLSEREKESGAQRPRLLFGAPRAELYTGGTNYLAGCPATKCQRRGRRWQRPRRARSPIPIESFRISLQFAHLAFSPLGVGTAALRLLLSQASRSARSEGFNPSAYAGIKEVARRRTPITSLRNNTCSTPPDCTRVRLVAPSSLKMPVAAVPSVICASVVS